jgi:uncharacterized protein (TIGR03000 family)
MFRQLSVWAGVSALIAAGVLLHAEPGRAAGPRGGVFQRGGGGRGAAAPNIITPNIQGAARFAVPQAAPQFVSPSTGMTSGFTRFNPSTSIYAPPNYDPSRLYPYYSYNYNYGLYPYYNRRAATYNYSSGYGTFPLDSESTEGYPIGMPSYGERAFSADTPAGRARAERVAHLTVTVPPGAELWFDKYKSSSTETVREFDTPSLNPGKYRYTVKASWQKGGQEVTQTRDVVVSPGSYVRLNFPLPSDGQGDKGSGKER